MISPALFEAYLDCPTKCLCFLKTLSATADS